MGNKRKTWLSALLLLLVLSVGGYGIVWPKICELTDGRSIPQLGANIGHFSLSDHNGHSIDEKSFGHQHLLIAFGYTYCPDICPTQLDSLSDALDVMGGEAENIQPLLITVDPERDSAPVLAGFVGAFHPRLLGLTGTPHEIAEIAERLDAKFISNRDKDGNEFYSVDHTTLSYLINPKGEVAAVFPYGSTPDFIAARIRENLTRPTDTKI